MVGFVVKVIVSCVSVVEDGVIVVLADLRRNDGAATPTKQR